jgi:type I restriction enzyme S subunit
MYQKALHRIRPIAGLVDPRFFQFCFWHYVVSGMVIPRPSETTIQHLPLERMVMLPIPLPALAEQHRIVVEVERRLSTIDELEAVVDANLKRAERLRQAILKRAFEGKLVPQNPNDEPASALLERIRAERATMQVAEGPRKQLKSGRPTAASGAGRLFQ